MKLIFKRLTAMVLSVMLVTVSLNLSMIASADDGIASYLGNKIKIIDTFEYSGMSVDDIWEPSYYNGHDGSYNATSSDILANAQVVEDPTDSNNHVLKMGTTSNFGAISLVMKKKYVPQNRRITSFSFKIYMKPSNSSDLDHIMLYKGEGVDPNPNDDYDEGVELCNVLGLRSDTSNGGQLLLANGKTPVYWDFKQLLSSKIWTDVKITYIYSGDKISGLTLKIGENEPQTISFSRYYLRAMAGSNFLYGFMFDSSSPALIDDVCFRYETLSSDSAELIGNNYKEVYADVLSLSISSVTADDKQKVEGAITALESLRSDVQAYLAAEREALDTLLSKIKADISDKEVAEFRRVHADILSKTVNTASNSDIVTLNAAVNDYLNLSKESQNILSAEMENLYNISRALKGDKIDAQIKSDIDGTFFDNFEYDNDIITADIYETTVFSTESAKSENDTSLKGNIVPSPTDPSNKVLMLDTASKANTFMYSLNSTYYPSDRRIESVSFKYYTTESTFEKKNISLILYRGIGTDGVYYQVQFSFRAGTAIYLSANESGSRWIDMKMASGWTDIKVEYIYDGGTLNGWKITVDNGASVESKTYTYIRYNNALGHMDDEGFVVGLGFAESSTSYIDDLCFSFSKTEDEIAEEDAKTFANKYSAILSKNISLVTEADKADFDTCLEAYASLTNLAKGYLSEQLNAIYALAEKFYPVSVGIAREYINTYSTSLNREISDYSERDFDSLKSAYDAYKALENTAKILVTSPWGAKIEDILKYISDNRTDVGKISDYPDGYQINTDFEYFQNPFVNDTEDKGQYHSEIVEDPLNSDNKVLQLSCTDANESAAFVLSDELWPDGSTQITEFSFKLYEHKNPSNLYPFICYNYDDIENFKSVGYQWGVIVKNGTLQYREMLDGNITLRQLAIDTIIYGEWMEVKFVYSDSNCRLTISTSDGTTVSTLNQSVGKKIAFAFKGVYSLYIDDLTVKFKEGDFDLDEKNEDIVAYYQGNTFQNPDDTVLITGDNIGNNVGSVELYTVPASGVNAANPQYIAETRFDSNETDEGVMTGATAPTWSSENASEIQFVQKTKTSLKFTLPESDEKAVYAVKLKSSYADDSGNPLYDDKILYLNNPYISYLMSDDGENATQGGYVRLIGENLYIDGEHTVTVVVKSLETGQCTTLNITKVYEGDAYSVTAAIPEDLAAGKYEIFIHNGYGDNTCWSEPRICSIVGKSAKEIWRSKGTFNVKDYGATGNAKTNDTPAVISAIAAAVKNGGGVVYFPKGHYRLLSTLIVPRNVSLEGEDITNTMIFWTAERWQYGEADDLISINGNCEITNLNIYASRSRGIIVQNDHATVTRTHNNHFGDTTDTRKNNVYIENVMIRTSPLSGFPTGGGFGYSPFGTESANITDVTNAVLAESCEVNRINLNCGGRNLQVKNVTYTIQGAKSFYSQALDTTGFYVNISNFYSEEFGVQGIVTNCIYEDSTTVETCNGISGSNMYYARNTHDRHYTNNREQWVSDGIPYYQDIRIQFIGKREDIVGAGNVDDVTYRMINPTRLTDDALIGMVVYVADGQGFGQIRNIVSSKVDGTFRVNKPFTIAPNRNSRIWIFRPRCSNYFVQNNFIEGSAGSAYGTSVNVVYDGNKFSYHGGQLFTANLTVIWYNTILNEVYENPLYVHGEGIGGTVAGGATAAMRLLFSANSLTTAAFMGTVLKNNTLNEWYIVVRSGQTDAVRDFIVEHNTFSQSPHVMRIETSSNSAFDGFYLRKNDIETTSDPYSSMLSNSTYNKLGYKRCIIVNSGESMFVLGDANLDGKVSLKDVSVIRYYYIGTIELTNEQLLRADVNQDGGVSLKDVSRIKQYLLYGIPLGSENTSGGGNESSSDSSNSSSSSGSTTSWMPGTW